jgi:hypothetical protein
LYASPNFIREIKSRRMKGAGHVAHMEKKRNADDILVGQFGGKRPPGRLGVDGETGGEGVEWMHLAQDRDQ